MTLPSRDLPERAPMREREARSPLPAHADSASEGGSGMTHEQLVEALRALDGVVDVGRDPPNFHCRSRPFLHFHQHEQGMYADVKFGSGDFEPLWASNPRERQELLARVCDHIESLERARKPQRGRTERRRAR
jgi:hypothetical protein